MGALFPNSDLWVGIFADDDSMQVSNQYYKVPSELTLSELGWATRTV